MSAERPGDPAVSSVGPLTSTADQVVDPRAVRLSLAPTSRGDDDPTMTISPVPADVLRPVERLAGRAILGGMSSQLDAARGADGPDGTGPTADGASVELLIDGRPLDARLVPFDGEHARLVEGPDGPEGVISRVILGARRRREADGAVVREVVVDGWRFDVEVESERRASLRERARRGHEVAGKSGPVEIHAIIPGRIVALSVTRGDPVAAGQQLLVLEAMKMQNELRAPREGSIERIAVAVGENVEVGDLLMVIT